MKKTNAQEKYDERIRIVNEAIELKEPSRIPFCLHIGTAPYTLAGTAYKDTFYDYDRANEALIKYYTEFQPDATTHTAYTSGKANELAGSTMMTGAGEAPFDIIGDYYRGTLAILTDQLEYEDEIEELCYRLADIQIESWSYFKVAPLPVKRVFFPLHKGVDGFMNPRLYEKLYWKPLKKCILALIDMGVTPYIYTEGKYDSRLEQLLDVPKGKVLYHFENVDIKRAKEMFSGTAAICGNLPIYLMEYATKERIIEETKKLLDICAPGGGYIFDCGGSVDGVKRENLEAVRETVDKYGAK